MVLQFVGFMAAFRNPGSLAPLLAGTLGGLLATWVTFTPCFLWIFVGAPFIERLRNVTGLNAALSAVTAAVVGVILNLAIWFAIHTIFGATVQVRTWPLALMHRFCRASTLGLWASLWRRPLRYSASTGE